MSGADAGGVLMGVPWAAEVAALQACSTPPGAICCRRAHDRAALSPRLIRSKEGRAGKLLMATEIVTERLRLRPFQVDDLEAFVAYRSDPDVARYQSWDASLFDDRCPIVPDLATPARSSASPESGCNWPWSIGVRAVLCGDCAVRVEIDPPATAEVGVTLAPSRQSKGLATEALAAVVTALFEQQGMHRVFAQADERNAAVKRLTERLGFRCEARLVEAERFKGAWSTLCVYAILDREWQARRNAGQRARTSEFLGTRGKDRSDLRGRRIAPWNETSRLARSSRSASCWSPSPRVGARGS